MVQDPEKRVLPIQYMMCLKNILSLLLNRIIIIKTNLILEFEERLKTNYDHPLAFDTDLLIHHVETLIDRKYVEKPVYDYSLHTRSEETIIIEPKDVIILEGILVLRGCEVT